MIPRETVDLIIETARIEEVVGDFVSLKKRGASLIGLCPFHNEKTPSFNVSPVKGIYKCFGCGKGGNAVNFMMDHDQMSYPEALRYLARKYQIQIEEDEISPEQQQQQQQKESLYIVCNYAAVQFAKNLWETEDGKAIGLSYFRERGFSDATIQKFQLGYSFENRTSFTKQAQDNGYQIANLVGSGLTIAGDNNYNFDRFAGRVMFPIHNTTGRAIGFGGRIMTSDKKQAKYINSPETAIYHKSQVLYGLYFAKKSIIESDNCFLAEGYTDVISLHQVGIENVVSSSGTSLTIEQIRAIKRYTANITILYDGDSAGIKASFRGIDLILEEGLNVKVLLFPDGDDPDSYSRKHSKEEVTAFIKANTPGFVEYKTKLLMQEAGNDPFKKTNVIREIASTIAFLPALEAGELIRRFSHNRLVDIEEQVFHNEVNKFRRERNEKKRLAPNQPPSQFNAPSQFNPQSQFNPPSESPTPDLGYNSSLSQGPGPSPDTILPPDTKQLNDELLAAFSPAEVQEREIIRILVNYGAKLVTVKLQDENGQPVETEETVTDIILHELVDVETVPFSNPIYKAIFDKYLSEANQGRIPDLNTFINKENLQISKVVIDLISQPHSLANWFNRHNIDVQTEENHLSRTVYSAIYSIKSRYIETLLQSISNSLKANPPEEETLQLIKQKMGLLTAKKDLNRLLGRIIIK